MLKPKWDKLGISLNWGVGSVREPRAGPRELSDASPSPSPPRSLPTVRTPSSQPRGLAAPQLRALGAPRFAPRGDASDKASLLEVGDEKARLRPVPPNWFRRIWRWLKASAQTKCNPRWSRAGRRRPGPASSPPCPPAGRPPPAVWPYALTRVRLQAVRGRVLRVSEWARGAQRLHGQVQPLFLPVSQFPLFI